jgi:hypothetical protein
MNGLFRWRCNHFLAGFHAAAHDVLSGRQVILLGLSQWHILARAVAKQVNADWVLNYECHG